MSESAEIQDTEPRIIEDLPPHRAAIPVAPDVLSAERISRRRNAVWIAVVFSLALHGGFFSAAVIWGQGMPLPDADGITPVIRVQVDQLRSMETVVEKTVATLPIAAVTDVRESDWPAEDVATSAPAIAAAPEQPAPPDLALSAETEAAPPATGVSQTEDAPARPYKLAAETETLPTEAVPEQRRVAALGDGPETMDIAMTRSREKVREEKNSVQEDYKPPSMRHKGPESSATSSFPDNGRLKAGPGASSSRGAVFSYKRRVRAQVMRNLPAGMWGAGRVVVGFRLSRTGGLLSASVLRSSGNAAIDQAALSCVRGAGPYPLPPQGASPDQLALSIDFRFQ